MGSFARSAKHHGIGLVDMLIVVTIVGILSATAALALDTDEFAVDAAARELVADAMQAQQLAIETRQSLGLRFDQPANSYFFIMADGTRPAVAETALLAGGEVSAIEVDRLLEARASGDPDLGSVLLNSADFGGGDDLIFDPDGSPREAGMVQLQVGNEVLRVRVQLGSGRIVITQP